jgi:hypothetical protein
VHVMPPPTTTDPKSPALHPSLRRRAGAAVEASLLLGTFAAIWISVGWALIAAFLE